MFAPVSKFQLSRSSGRVSRIPPPVCGASGKFHCCQNPTFCIHVVLDQDERLIVRIYHIKWVVHFHLIKSECEFILLGPLCKKILEWASSRTGKHCSTSSKSNHSTQCQLSTMTMLMTSSFSPLILDIHIFSCCKKTNTRYREKIKVSNVLDKQALCLLVQVQPLYNTFHLCICKALMMGSLRLWLLDCDQKKRFSPCLPCNPLRLEIVCPRVPLRYLGGLPPNTWVPKGGSQ